MIQLILRPSLKVLNLREKINLSIVTNLSDHTLQRRKRRKNIVCFLDQKISYPDTYLHNLPLFDHHSYCFNVTCHSFSFIGIFENWLKQWSKIIKIMILFRNELIEYFDYPMIDISKN